MRLVTSLPDEVVKTQLARIVGSRQFCNAPRLSRFLNYVVEQSLAGQADRLKGYTIGLEVFDKDTDFDPQTDTIVRVQARALRQKLDQYYAQDGANDPVHITIAKGGYEPTFFVSWDGERPKDPDAIFGSRQSNRPSIAVLPFDDFSQDKNHEYLSQGLTEGTIANLSRYKDLSVFSRSTTQRAKLDQLSIAQMYHLFHPDFVLEGSFRLSKDLVETIIKLIDASTGEIVLTETLYGRLDPSDIYEMQDEMVLRITSHIAVEYGPIGFYARRADRPGLSTKWETYAWISRYFEHGIELDPVARDEIKAGLTRGVETDPNSSAAHAALAMIDIEQYRAMTKTQGLRETLDVALEHALLAVRFDPQSAMAHQSLAIARFHQRQFDDFRASVKRALKLNPGHSDMLAMFGICFSMLGDWDEAVPLLDRAVALNPLHPGWYHIPKALFLAVRKGPDEAIEELKKNPIPDYYAFHFMLVWCHVEAGDMAAAQFEKNQLLKVAPDVEKLVRRQFDTWCLNDEIADRIISALLKVGLKPVD